MLVRHNVGNLRGAALGALGLVLLACTNATSTTPKGASPAANVASSRAADLRTQLDLLLAEHVMIVAKESAGAVNHSDEYSSYTAVLSINATDLTSLMSRAFGNTAATQLARGWSIQNGYLVDYAIGVVTHNDDKANGAMSGLINGFVPQFAQQIRDATQLPLDSLMQLVKQQVLGDKAFIDDVFAQRYPAFYKNLHAAYVQTSRLGDAIAGQTAQKYPDKFPGAPAAQAVDARVTLNLLLQEHSYIATMATDAVVAGRSSEGTAAAPALAVNSESLRMAFVSVQGNDAAAQIDRVWAARNKALIDYASGASPTSDYLTQTFVPAFAYVSHVDRLRLLHQVQATIKVIDDQRAKSSKTGWTLG